VIYERALNILSESLEIFKSLNNKIGALGVIVALASVHFIRGEYEKVKEVLKEVSGEDIKEMDVEDIVKYALLKLVVDEEDILKEIPQREGLKSRKEIIFAFDVREYREKKDIEILKRLKDLLKDLINPFYRKIVEKLSSD